jgi:hypothetical protein
MLRKIFMASVLSFGFVAPTFAADGCKSCECCKDKKCEGCKDGKCGDCCKGEHKDKEHACKEEKSEKKAD